jgi:hypothetical protein
MPNRLLTREEWSAVLAQFQHRPLGPDPVGMQDCQHCWHTPRRWAGQLPSPRFCCWCGMREGPQHGPYAEG